MSINCLIKIIYINLKALVLAEKNVNIFYCHQSKLDDLPCVFDLDQISRFILESCKFLYKKLKMEFSRFEFYHSETAKQS